MEYLSDFQTLAECMPNNLIMDMIKSAMEHLHSAGYVHGDLRSNNILVHYLNTVSSPAVRFVDWDWAGEFSSPLLVTHGLDPDFLCCY